MDAAEDASGELNTRGPQARGDGRSFRRVHADAEKSSMIKQSGCRELPEAGIEVPGALTSGAQ